VIFDGNFIPKSTGFVLEMKVVYCLESKSASATQNPARGLEVGAESTASRQKNFRRSERRDQRSLLDGIPSAPRPYVDSLIEAHRLGFAHAATTGNEHQLVRRLCAKARSGYPPNGSWAVDGSKRLAAAITCRVGRN
jgi:hypothetical protein